MAAKKYIQSWEATFKLHSGLAHQEIILKANTYDEGVKRAMTAALAWGKRHEGLLLGMALKAQNTAFTPLLPATDVPN